MLQSSEAEAKATAGSRKGEAIVKARHAVEDIAEGIEAMKPALTKALDEVAALPPVEITRPEAIAAAHEAMKVYLTNTSSAAAKAKEVLDIEAGSLGNKTKSAKIKNILAEVEGMKTAAAIIRGAKEEARRALTKSELNNITKAAIETSFEAKAGNVSREDFWTAYTEVNFAVKPTRAAYLLAFGKEEGAAYYTIINNLFDNFLGSLLAVRKCFGEAEAYTEAEAEAYSIFKDICNKLHFCNTENVGVASDLIHTLAARGYNWRIEYDEDKKPRIIAAVKTNNTIMFEIFAEITRPEAIAAAIEAREAKKKKRRLAAEAKRKAKEAKKKPASTK